jgi:hypothetical protein
MIVDLDEKTESGTFELKGGGKVTIRLLTLNDLREIRKATGKTVAEYPLLEDPKTKELIYRRFEGFHFDSDLFDEMKWDRIITGWEDLFDKNKKPIPVTKEMKVLLMTSGKAPEFVEAVENGLKALREADEAKSKAAEKNSSTGSSLRKIKPGPD